MFQVDTSQLGECRRALSSDPRLRWVIGGSGSGKSTVCRAIAASPGVHLIDMDARIYGSFHRLYSPHRHPVSSAWASAGDGMRWLLDMSWDEFDAFNHATLPENLDLLAAELEGYSGGDVVLVDGGVCCPTLLASAVGVSRVVCLSRRDLDAAALWSQPGERAAMRDMVLALDGTAGLWDRFVDFDRQITESIAAECVASGVQVCAWSAGDDADVVHERVRAMLGLSD